MKSDALITAAIALSCTIQIFAQRTIKIPGPNPKVEFTDSSGKPIAGGLVWTYVAGTNTPRPTFVDALGAIPNANPVVLDTSGRASIWIGPGSYKLVLEAAPTANGHGTAVWTLDNVAGAAANSFANLAAISDTALARYSAPFSAAVERSVHAKLNDVVHTKDFGAKCDGATDDAVALQAALDGIGVNGSLMFPAGVCKTSKTLRYYSGQRLYGQSAGQVVAGQSTIKYAGVPGQPLLAPKNQESDTTNLVISNLAFDGGGTANPVVNWYRTSYGSCYQCTFLGMAREGGVGLAVDSNMINQAYFNIFYNNKWDGEIGFSFQRGANNNQIIGGKVGNGLIGGRFLSKAVDNTIFGTDCEMESRSCWDVEASANRFYGTSQEVTPIGFDLSSGLAGITVIRDSNFAPTVKTSVLCAPGTASCSGLIEEYVDNSGTTYHHSWGPARQTLVEYSGSTSLNQDLQPASSSAVIHRRFDRNVTTSGDADWSIFRADGTNSMAFRLQQKTGSFWSAGNISSNAGSVQMFADAGKGEYGFATPGMKLHGGYSTGGSPFFIDPILQNNTGAASVNMFRNTATGGSVAFSVFKGDGSATVNFSSNATLGYNYLTSPVFFGPPYNYGPGTISFGGEAAPASRCGGGMAAGCLVIVVGGTTRYVPYY